MRRGDKLRQAQKEPKSHPVSARLDPQIKEATERAAVKRDVIGSTEQMFMQDRYGCIQQSQQNRAAVNNYGGYSAVIVNRGVFMSCMGARGYVLDPNGALVAVPGTEIRMVD